MPEPRVDREQKSTSATETTGKKDQANPQSSLQSPQPSTLSRRYDYPQAISPFDMLGRMSREMDRLFGGGLLPSWGLSNVLAPVSEALWNPQVEMFERDGKLVVRADLPGLNKKDVKVELRDDALILQGERREEHEEKDDLFYRSERSYGSFYRAIPLPEGTSGENCKATFNNGVLEVTMATPKQKDRAGRKIEIS